MPRKLIRWVVLFIGVSLVLAHEAYTVKSARDMAAAAGKFLASLTAEQKAKATYKFDDAQRFDWHFIPKERKGIPLKELDAGQRKLAHDFLKTGLSQRGYLKATTIIELETVLRALEAGAVRRDPELYFFTVFGTPSANGAWGWRVEGHHLSLNFTIVDGKMVATTPSFFGANPAEVREGPHKGLRALQGEEDLARDLLNSLTAEQRERAILDKNALTMVTGNSRKANPVSPAGISAAEFTASQKASLKKLLQEYASSMAPELSQARMEKLQRAGMEKISFGWAGSAVHGQKHYYRVQGPTFLIEYDNTQNDGNHIHSVWRDFNGDFGDDLLAEHYRTTRH
ncbi:MAG TPA: DUF3500 domain-containing protein [Acidobacteriota bacterium]|jgi:hypothetical protein